MRVIGTAGHVDHGKSTLVRALTGIDPDRLAEEQARQITIDLGFAWLHFARQQKRSASSTCPVTAISSRTCLPGSAVSTPPSS
ncbi:MAG: GTP-binding protein [Anaerolineae bacterium]